MIWKRAKLFDLPNFSTVSNNSPTKIKKYFELIITTPYKLEPVT